MPRLFYLAILAMLLAGCTVPGSTLQQDAETTTGIDSQAVETVATEVVTNAATNTQQPVTTPEIATAAPVLVPTDTPSVAEEASQAPTDWLTTVTVEDGLYILGNPNAPIRLIDYSDFL